MEPSEASIVLSCQAQENAWLPAVANLLKENSANAKNSVFIGARIAWALKFGQIQGLSLIGFELPGRIATLGFS